MILTPERIAELKRLEHAGYGGLAEVAWDAAVRAERERLTAPGPCGKHPAMFYVENEEMCACGYTLHQHQNYVNDKKQPSDCANFRSVGITSAYCTLCAEIAKVEAERDMMNSQAVDLAQKFSALSSQRDTICQALRFIANQYLLKPTSRTYGPTAKAIRDDILALLVSPRPAEPKEKP